MKCTLKEQETCQVEKMGCEGCYYADDGVAKEEIECSICGSRYAESYYKSKQDKEIFCDACLLEGFCSTETTIHYFSEDGEYLGSDDEIEEVLEKVCDYTDFEKVKGE